MLHHGNLHLEDWQERNVIDQNGTLFETRTLNLTSKICEYFYHIKLVDWLIYDTRFGFVLSLSVEANKVYVH